MSRRDTHIRSIYDLQGLQQAYLLKFALRYGSAWSAHLKQMCDSGKHHEISHEAYASLRNIYMEHGAHWLESLPLPSRFEFITPESDYEVVCYSCAASAVQERRKGWDLISPASVCVDYPLVCSRCSEPFNPDGQQTSV